jgi:hypothetical protein
VKEYTKNEQEGEEEEEGVIITRHGIVRDYLK